MRQLKYYIACTFDRFIARKNDSFDFFSMEEAEINDLIKNFPETFPAHVRLPLGITAENQCFDTVLMGRRTYEIGVKEGITNPYPHMKQYLFSSNLKKSPDSNIELISNEPILFVKKLKQQSDKDIWLCGGGTLATLLFSEIDEVILKVHPIILGEGIPLFSGVVKETSLELVKSKVYNNGFMLLYYRLKHYK